MTPRFWCIVPAAGIGQRMQASCPKQYLPLGDASVIENTLSHLLAVPMLEKVIVAIHPNDQHWHTLSIASHTRIEAVTGGRERSDSVLQALHFLQPHVGANDWVVVHDAARPCLSAKTIERIILAIGDHPIGGIAALPVADTLKQVGDAGIIEKTIDRRGVWQAQTPQVFRYQQLLQALQQLAQQDVQITDEASALEACGQKVKVVLGCRYNIKITQPEDLAFAQSLIHLAGVAV